MKYGEVGSKRGSVNVLTLVTIKTKNSQEISALLVNA